MAYKPDVVIYHDNCDDGFAAAWIARQEWPDAVLMSMNYGMDLPDFAFADHEVLVVDFSLTEEQCKDLVGRGCWILMLDHHKTAEDRLMEMGVTFLDRPTAADFNPTQGGDRWQDRVFCEFDMDRSGCRMLWDFCHPGVRMPSLLQRVEDRDLWRFSMKDTKPLSLWIRSRPRMFSEWSEMIRQFEFDPEACVAEGLAIDRYQQRLVSAICDQAIEDEFEGHAGAMWVHCCPYELVSEVCHELLQRYPNAPFAAAVLKTPHGRTVSMRSDDDRVDVSEIAKSRGGGGHRNAAGFRIEEDWT